MSKAQLVLKSDITYNPEGAILNVYYGIRKDLKSPNQRYKGPTTVHGEQYLAELLSTTFAAQLVSVLQMNALSTRTLTADESHWKERSHQLNWTCCHIFFFSNRNKARLLSDELSRW